MTATDAPQAASKPTEDQTPSPSTFPPEPTDDSTARAQAPPQANVQTDPVLPAPAGDTTRPPASLTTRPKTRTPTADQTAPQANEHSKPMGYTPAGPTPSPPMSAEDLFATLDLIGDAVEADPAFLALAASLVDDLERVRIANANRLAQLTRTGVDADGELRGLGLDARHPYVRRFAGVVTAVEVAEHEAVLGLQALMRKHPLGPWVKGQIGMGEKQTARLLATIGDPYIRPELVRADGTLEPSRPRRVYELWAFCGLHVLPARQSDDDAQGVIAGGDQTGHLDHPSSETHTSRVGVAPRRQKGLQVNWSTEARTRTYLIAESCMKQPRSPFRAVYEQGRVKYADAVHAVECVRCGPSRQPALPGSPLSAGHQHARAMRLTMKAILKALWVESKRLHELNVELSVTSQQCAEAG